MKKIFTLICMAAMAVSVNAQTPDDEYLAIDDEKNFNTEFANAIVGEYTDGEGNKKVDYTAKNIVNGQSVVTYKGSHVTMTAVSNGTPEDLLKSEGYTQEQSFDNTNWPKWGDPQWKVFNKNKKIWHYNDANEQVTDFIFYAIQGTANPVTGFKSRVVTSGEEKEFEKLTADYEGYYFVPGTSTSVPISGEYFTFKADAAGMFRIGFAVTSGTNRYMYIVEESTVRTLETSEYKVEGYVNGVDNEKYEPMWQASMMVNADRSIGNATGQTYKDDSWQEVNELTRDKFGWFVFNAKANETYYIFTPNTQFGFRSYEFYINKSIDDYQPQNPAGIESIKTVAAKNANDAIYNLAGQKVDKSYKGIKVQNGKKFF
ncbi:MAG: hypothetical protein J6E43_07710 [Prevotella sp.]|nr:hypothetical protein [Prevotella sp.]